MDPSNGKFNFPIMIIMRHIFSCALSQFQLNEKNNNFPITLLAGRIIKKKFLSWREKYFNVFMIGKIGFAGAAGKRIDSQLFRSKPFLTGRAYTMNYPILMQLGGKFYNSKNIRRQRAKNPLICGIK